MTAVEWLVNKILVEMELYTDEEGNWIDNARIAYVNSYKDSIDLKEFVQQAKKMEKQQIEDAYVDGFKECEKIHEEAFFIQDLSEKYYNETYRK